MKRCTRTPWLQTPERLVYPTLDSEPFCSIAKARFFCLVIWIDKNQQGVLCASRSLMNHVLAFSLSRTSSSCLLPLTCSSKKIAGLSVSCKCLLQTYESAPWWTSLSTLTARWSAISDVCNVSANQFSPNRSNLLLIPLPSAASCDYSTMTQTKRRKERKQKLSGAKDVSCWSLRLSSDMWTALTPLNEFWARTWWKIFRKRRFTE